MDEKKTAGRTVPVLVMLLLAGLTLGPAPTAAALPGDEEVTATNGDEEGGTHEWESDVMGSTGLSPMLEVVVRMIGRLVGDAPEPETVAGVPSRIERR